MKHSSEKQKKYENNKYQMNYSQIKGFGDNKSEGHSGKDVMKKESPNMKNTPLELIAKIEQIFNSQASIKQYFNSELAWLGERRNVWERHSWRVGLIGVTSAGKSTLINALIGEDLLPANAHPTTNILTHCSWIDQSEPYIETVFHDRVTQANKNLKKVLAGLADEDRNPGNKKGVKEIHIYSPKFALGENIVLVDTPGLDAIGQDKEGGHDDITMKLLLPTIDMALYLTTCKVTADKENAYNLAAVDAENKPILMIQTMIDSIKEKIGQNATVEKDFEQLLFEYRVRLESLLKKSNKSNIKGAGIIQISALWALNPNERERSNIDAMVQAIIETINKLKPNFFINRCRQIIQETNKWIENLKHASKLSKLIHEKELYLASIEEKVASFSPSLALLKESLKEIQSFKNDFYRKAKSYKDKGIGSHEIKQIEGDLNFLKKQCSKSNSSFSKLINKNLKEIETFASEANISDEDLYFELNLENVSIQTKVKTHTITKSKRVKQEGMGGFFKRLVSFNNCGYEDREYQENHVEFLEIKNTEKQIKKWHASLMNNLNGFEKKINGNYAAILGHKKAEIKGLKSKTKIPLSKETSDSILNDLKKNIGKYAKSNSMSVNTGKASAFNNIPKPKSEEITISELTVNLNTLAHQVTINQRIKIRHWIFDSFFDEKYNEILIFGYDNECINNLIRYFAWDLLSDFNIGAEEGVKEITVQNRNVVIINENNYEDIDSFHQYLKPNAICFFHFNLIQSGHTEKKLSDLLRFKEWDNVKCIPVIDSIEAFINLDNIEGALENFKKQKGKYFDAVNSVLVNHKNPVYTMIFHELFYGDYKNPAHRDEINFMKEISSWLPDEKIREGISHFIRPTK